MAIRVKSMIKENGIDYSMEEIHELLQSELEIVLDENSKILKERRDAEEAAINNSNNKHKK